MSYQKIIVKRVMNSTSHAFGGAYAHKLGGLLHISLLHGMHDI